MQLQCDTNITIIIPISFLFYNKNWSDLRIIHNSFTFDWTKTEPTVLWLVIHNAPSNGGIYSDGPFFFFFLEFFIIGHNTLTEVKLFAQYTE